MEKLEVLISLAKARLKALVALLGVALFYLQAVQSVHPDHRLSALIGLLTVLGVHQVQNL